MIVYYSDHTDIPTSSRDQQAGFQHVRSQQSKWFNANSSTKEFPIFRGFVDLNLSTVHTRSLAGTPLVTYLMSPKAKSEKSDNVCQQIGRNIN